MAIGILMKLQIKLHTIDAGMNKCVSGIQIIIIIQFLPLNQLSTIIISIQFLFRLCLAK